MPATKLRRSQRIDRGEDPATEKRQRREAPTVRDLLDRYVEDHLPKKARYGTWRERDRANRTIEIASKCFTMAMTRFSSEREPWRSPVLGNPCKGVKRNPEDGKERFFDEAEIAATAEALDMADERSSADCIRLL